MTAKIYKIKVLDFLRFQESPIAWEPIRTAIKEMRMKIFKRLKNKELVTDAIIGMNNAGKTLLKKTAISDPSKGTFKYMQN